MNQLRPIVVFVVIGMSIGLPTARSESRAGKKIEDNFKVKWTSVSYNRTVSVRNAEASEDQGRDVSQRVSVSCEVEMLDPNFVLGISRGPMIEEMTDDKGVQISVWGPSSRVMDYKAPNSRPRVVFPPKPAKWKTAVRSALKLPPKGRPRPLLVPEVQPTQMEVDVIVRPGEQSGEKVNRIKGYFYALVADSFEYVDVPFKKSDKWVRLTPDLEVRVDHAFCPGRMYRLRTKVRLDGGRSGQIPSDDTALPEQVLERPSARARLGGWTVSADTDLPKRLVANRLLIGPDDKPTGLGMRELDFPFRVGSNSRSSGPSRGQITKIRYVIAVNPTHYKIPFLFENIPLAKP